MSVNAQENLTAWKLFRELVHYGEITAAANALNIDAGNASRLLTALERDLGFAVFDRTKRPFVLTREGKQLITNVETLLEGERNLKNLYRRVQKGENVVRIRLGVCTDSDPSFLFSLIEEYAQIDPSLEICLIDRLGLEDVQNGAVHLAYIPYLAMRSRNDNFHGFCGLSGLSGSFRNTEDTARFKKSRNLAKKRSRLSCDNRTLET